MHYVDIEEIREVIPENFERRASTALRAVERAAQQAEREAIADGKTQEEVDKLVHSAISNAIRTRSIWSDLADLLGNLRYRKCWYCDSLQWRSDMPIDHFRPKNEVTEEPTHPGYWWLAFEWTNYRFCCTYCNSHRKDEEGGTEGGKQNHFPLVEGSARAFRRDDDYKNIENPKLLDPIELDEPKMIVYQMNGFPRWNPARVRTRVDRDRVTESIGIYHLHHSAAVRVRKTIARRIEQYVERIDELYLVKPRTDLIHIQITNLRRDLLKIVNKKAEFSIAAVQYLRQFRDRDWVEDLLDLISNT